METAEMDINGQRLTLETISENSERLRQGDINALKYLTTGHATD